MVTFRKRLATETNRYWSGSQGSVTNRFGSFACSLDGPLADDPVPALGVGRVQHRRLPRGHAALVLGEHDPKPTILAPMHLARHRRPVGPELDLRDERQRRDLAGPRRPAGQHLADRGEVGRADRHRPGHRLDAEHVARPLVADADAEPPALADGEAEGAVVLTDRRPGRRVDDRAGPAAEPPGEEAAGVAVGDEADVVRVRLGRDGELALGRDRPHPVLRHGAEREHRRGQLFGGQHPQYVGLVLGRVHRPAQLAVGQPGVVAGDDGVEPQRPGTVEHGGELDLLVAPHAGIGSAAGRVLGDEVLDHVLGEALGQIPDVERDAQLVGHPARVVSVLDAAAPAGAAAQRLPVRRQRQVHAGDLVTGVDGQGRGDRGVHSPAHRGEHAHGQCCPSPARRARSTTGPMTSRTASTSASVEVCPRLNRSELRARSGSAPTASSTWLGRATPALHADPVEHSIPRASSSISSASPSAPGKDRWALPGSRPGPPARPSSNGAPLSWTSGTWATTPATRRSRSAASRAPRSSRDPTALTAATVSPTIAATSSVPDRTSRSWPPPCSSGVHSASRRSRSTPAPMGPPSLWPVMVSASAPLAPKSTGTCPTACTASVCRGTPTACATSASAATSLTVPISLLAHMTLATATSPPSPSASPRAARPAGSASGPPRPVGSTGSQVMSAPSCLPSHSTLSRTAWCSAGLTTIRRRRESPCRRAQKSPLTARLSLSVPPPVNRTSDGRAPSASASRSRDCSAARRAARPLACREDALPTRPSCSVIAASTSGNSGVVAAWSR